MKIESMATVLAFALLGAASGALAGWAVVQFLKLLELL